jgi:hypothetical protein
MSEGRKRFQTDLSGLAAHFRMGCLTLYGRANMARPERMIWDAEQEV